MQTVIKPCYPVVHSTSGWEKGCHISSDAERELWTITHVPNEGDLSAMSSPEPWTTVLC